MTMAQTDSLAGFGATQTALMRLLLRNKSGLTVDGIAEGLSVTRTAVNQHLASLERDGYVMRKEVVATGGRPSRAFGLSERGIHLFPKNYDMFSMKTLEALIDTIGEKAAKKVLERLGRDLGTDLSSKLSGKKLKDKMPAIAGVLQEFGYDANYTELKQKAPTEIKAYNCIYHALAQAHPDVCALDLAFLHEASGAKVDHVACMAKGDNACQFRFQK